MEDDPPPERGRPNLRLLTSELDGAEPAPPPGEDAGEGAGAGPKASKKPKKDKPPKPPERPRRPGEIFPDAPVTALGVLGADCYYLDALRQMQVVSNHTRDRMRMIFGGSHVLAGAFPQKAGRGKAGGWHQEEVASAMTTACHERGVWNPHTRIRGIGAWPTEAGGLILHCGNVIFRDGAELPPGLIDGYVYPAAAPIPVPKAYPDLDAPGRALLEVLETWNWRRAALDAHLLFGWIVAAMFGGALKWRPLCWITGDAGSGKSTVHEILREVMGGSEAVLQSSDATEAGVRQFLMQSTIPVALDEIEPERESGNRAQAVIKLARQAASGGVVLRGSAEHTGQEFRARSAFLFSSILIPPLLDQDISRMAVLELEKLERGATSPIIEPAHWRRIGQAIRARVMAEWHRFAPTLELYRAALSEGGHDARGCDQYGTLLALADLALEARTPSADMCEAWAAKLSAEMVAAQTDRSSDWEKMLNHLFGQQIDIYRSGERHTIGRWIMAAAGFADSPDDAKARRALPAYGIKVEGRGQHAAITVANAHPGLAGLFRDTHWHAPAGQRGGWAQAAKRVPKSELTEKKSFDGVSSRAFRFPLASVPNLLDPDPPPPGTGFPPVAGRQAADPGEDFV